MLQRMVSSCLEPVPCHLLGNSCSLFREICTTSEQARMIQLLGARVASIASSVVVEECPHCMVWGTRVCAQCGSALRTARASCSLTLDKLFPNGGRFNSKGEPQVAPVLSYRSRRPTPHCELVG